ncbi:MAG: hypothetical protein ACRDPS_16800 [Nocardioides sp.]|uniref:hypothetical protein n=1 Tax=Nocardioides sp. TaxID=35761 RepID=UPI003D6A281A
MSNPQPAARVPEQPSSGGVVDDTTWERVPAALLLIGDVTVAGVVEQPTYNEELDRMELEIDGTRYTAASDDSIERRVRRS